MQKKHRKLDNIIPLKVSKRGKKRAAQLNFSSTSRQQKTNPSSKSLPGVKRMSQLMSFSLFVASGALSFHYYLQWQRLFNWESGVASLSFVAIGVYFGYRGLKI